MFTGLIEVTGRVAAIQPLVISFETSAFNIKEGDSVSINGVCLTALRPTSRDCTFEISPETLSITTLGMLNLNDEVNIEPALLASSRLGGHMVQGHIDTVSKIISFDPVGEFFNLEIEIPSTLRRMIVPKGSITVDGVSLTVNSVADNRMSLMIIPHTWQRTILKHYKPNQLVNLEVDILGKYIVQYLENYENHSRSATH